jgi:general secretion pathway protein L
MVSLSTQFPTLDRWADGLAGAYLSARSGLRPARRYCIRANARPLAIVACIGDERHAMCTVDTLPDGRIGPIPPDRLHEIKDQCFDILVPPTAMFKHALDPLPADSRPFVDDIVRHQLEELSPWPSRDVLFTTILEDRNDGSIDVTMWATVRTAIGAALSVAEACEPAQIRIVVEDSLKGDETYPPLIVPLKGEGGGRSQRVAWYAIVALILFATSFVGSTTLWWQSLDRQSASLDRAIAKSRSAINDATVAAPDNASDPADLYAMKRHMPLASIVIESLSRALPDDTYLTELHLDANKLRIAGVSARASDLVRKLEASGSFQDATFYAATTRLPNLRVDHFYIETKVIPTLKVSP